MSSVLDELTRGRGRLHDDSAVDHYRDLLTGGFEFPGLALGQGTTGNVHNEGWMPASHEGEGVS